MNRFQKQNRLVQIELVAVLALHLVLFLLGLAAWAGFLFAANDGTVPMTQLEQRIFEPAGFLLVLAMLLLPALVIVGLVIAVYCWVVVPLTAELKADQPESSS